MTPAEFIEHWKNSQLNESQGAQIHFFQLCDLLGVPEPTGTSLQDGYGFEVNVGKIGGGAGYADAWKRGCFAWEYKSPGSNLNEALKQLKLYASDLENPPLLIVSDMRRIELHTNWTNMVQEKHGLELDDLADPSKRQKLKWAFSEDTVGELRPKRSANATTEEVAKKFVAIAQNLRDRGHDPEKVAHFVNRMVFCMFAEDVGLLPSRMFERMLEASLPNPKEFLRNAETLFTAMAKQHGRVGYDPIEWFNGGLFEDGSALPLNEADIRIALEAARQNWSEINPSIMGTLFERGLDPGKRSQLGAHYTDAEKIMLIVRPVIIEPLLREWEAAKPEIADLLARSKRHHDKATKTKLFVQAKNAHQRFVERLASFRVLDPACGSGNFLYLALKALKDIELRVNFEAEEMGLTAGLPQVGPECVRGIEINAFAAELARVSVWIGEIQWMRQHNLAPTKNPILKSLETIECRDALLNDDGSEAEWPAADAIIGNPPFLGTQLMIGTLGERYAGQVRSTYARATDGAVDLVTYWFVKAWAAIVREDTERAGFVATQSIRRGASRALLKRITDEGAIFEAWQDEPWIVDGAAVRVSLICFAKSRPDTSKLDGNIVSSINADLTSSLDTSEVRTLLQNAGVAFQGTTKAGAFEIPRETAERWLRLPKNPNSKPNSDVLRPWANGSDITDRSSNRWIIDFGTNMPERDAAMYAAPFEHLREHVKPARARLRREAYRKNWWIHAEARPGLRKAIASLERFMVTPRVAKYRPFVWLNKSVLPDTRLVVIARDDDTTFGILHSRFHELWSLRLGGRHGVGNDPQYTPSLAFETFPFPEGLTPNIPATSYAGVPHARAIAAAASRLNELRENWLNPPDLVQRVSEVVPGYPDRIVPLDDNAAATLKNRTLTKLYNERPAWLDNAHRDLDAAVAAAYDWPTDLTDDQIIERLFALNQERAARQ